MRVYVTGFLDPEDDEVDASDSTGLTEAAFLKYSSQFPLDDLTFEQEPD